MDNKQLEKLYEGHIDEFIAEIRHNPPKFSNHEYKQPETTEEALEWLKGCVNDSQKLVKTSNNIRKIADDLNYLARHNRANPGMSTEEIRRVKRHVKIRKIIHTLKKAVKYYVNAAYLGRIRPMNVEHAVAYPLFEAARRACRQYRSGSLEDQFAWWLEIAGICDDFVALATGMSQRIFHEALEFWETEYLADFELFESCDPKDGCIFTMCGPFVYHTGIVLNTVDTPIGPWMLVLDANHGTFSQLEGDRRVHLYWKHSGLKIIPNFRIVLDLVAQIRFFDPYSDYPGLGNTPYEIWCDLVDSGVRYLHIGRKRLDINPPLFKFYKPPLPI